MSECCGFMGKIFGHDFHNFLLKGKFYRECLMDFSIRGEINISKIESYLDNFREIYEIRCKRCGKEKK